MKTFFSQISLIYSERQNFGQYSEKKFASFVEEKENKLIIL